MSPNQHLVLIAILTTLGVGLGVFFEGWGDAAAFALLLPGALTLTLPWLRARGGAD